MEQQILKNKQTKRVSCQTYFSTFTHLPLASRWIGTSSKGECPSRVGRVLRGNCRGVRGASEGKRHFTGDITLVTQEQMVRWSFLSCFINAIFAVPVKQTIAIFGIIFFLTGIVQAQTPADTSAIVISNFQVSEVVNDPETMNVEGYGLEFNITQPENLAGLTFEVQLSPESGEPEIFGYPFEILTKDGGIYLVVQHNHFHIENGQVQMYLNIGPIPFIENIQYRLYGMDIQGLPIRPATYSRF